jgi:multiple sugar transport system substrate-binding protein/putative aldouronate transport system substrate-binding protein
MTVLAALLSGCGKTTTNNNNNTATATPGGTDNGTAVTGTSNKYPDFITVDVFDSQANFQGIQSGWFAKVVKDKFNMELNIIAPNVAGGGDTLYQTRSANGNLGDLILTNADQGRLKDLVTANLVLDMSSYITNEKNLQDRMAAIKNTSALAAANGLWAVPSQTSLLSPTEPTEATDPTNAPSLRWDLYKQLGYPTIGTLEDLLPILKKMQDNAGTSTSGKKVYAFSLFKDWDGDLMQNAGALTALYGYNPQGFALYAVAGDDIQSIIDDKSQYVRGLKFLYNANQMGLVDPESTTQNFDTVAAKYTDGAVLYSLWPWLGGGMYNTADNTAAGKGFASATLQDGKYVSWGNTPLGTNTFTIMVGSKAKDPQRLVDFIDWLYSPEGIEMSATQTGGKCGPEGLTWELKDGKPVLTDFGKKAFVSMDQTLEVPAEWGGGTWKDGISALNYNAVGITEVDPTSGINYNYSRWDDYATLTQTALSKDWSEHNDNYLSAIQYFKDKNFLAVVPGIPFVGQDYSTDIQAIKEQCKQIIVQYSWQMVFAKDDAEFNSLLKEMQDTVTGLGFDQVYAIDKKNCEDRYAGITQFLADNPQ